MLLLLLSGNNKECKGGVAAGIRRRGRGEIMGKLVLDELEREVSIGARVSQTSSISCSLLRGTLF